MFSCRFHLFCLVSILYISLCAGSSSNVKKNVDTERQALLKFKASLIDVKGILSSWTSEDCCKWKGITCDNSTGYVIMLDLQGNRTYPRDLTGTIDSSLCELQHLTSLNLSANYLQGKIPKCIGSLSQLTGLSLAENELVGAIPHTLGNLSNLQTLDLGPNDFLVSNDLQWVSHLSSLRHLHLSYVSLSQAFDWPSSISKLSSLMVLRLDGCGLPQLNLKSKDWVFNFSKVLTKLDLSDNELEGPILHTLGNLSNLQTLDLGGNGFLVSNDLEWVSHLSSLRYLDLSNVNLSQAFDWPSSISKLSSLMVLNLGGCRLPQLNLKSKDWLFNVSKVLTKLDLSGNELEGSIPKSLQRLCQLKILDLSNNKLSGNLNDSIQYLCSTHNGIEELYIYYNPFNGPFPDVSKFSSLKILELQNTSIHGSLPQSLGHMPYLEELDLSHNQLSGSLSSLGHLPHLRVLFLQYNQLSGSMSFFEVTEFVSLYILDLSHNQLTGTLPYNIGKLSNLAYLFVASNKLNGVVNEEHLPNQSKLEYLYMDQNSLSFNLSSDWVPPFQLSYLSVSSCILGPSFPSWLKHLRSLQILQISHCGISDSFPKWFWDLSTNLYYLNVSHNNLSGSLPKSIPYFKLENAGAKWDLSFNNLLGPLPHFPPSLGLLSVSNNMFSGSMSSFCSTSFPNLTHLDLSNNFLEGQLLDCWGQLKEVEILNLATNNFFGRIPKSLGTLQQIETIHLNNNNFSGKIPTLTHCNKLKFIDFGDNNLEGTLPAWLGQNQHKLIVLRLRANKFHGSLPVSFCDLLHLQVLDLSNNNITGRIPQCLDHIIALTNIKFPREPISYNRYGLTGLFGGDDIGLFSDNTTLRWKGENREYGKNIGFLTAIDLSCNQLIGEIPESISTLVALVSLNLSGNNLTRFIPNNIDHMKMLESLDLSRNYLYGRIPESISNMSFLNYLNLSINNLSGKIPTGTQLDTFSASTYIGNHGLCGPPLSDECIEDGNTHKNGTKGYDDDDELISFGFYISLGLGFIIGFWGVCGTLVLNASRQHVYFRFFNNIYDWIYVQVVVITIRMKRRLQVQD